MGAWGSGNFENDAALDWLAELDEGTPDMVLEALARVAKAPQDSYIDADACAIALAAAEVVAASGGVPAAEVPEKMLKRLKAIPGTPSPEGVPLATEAAARIESSSELQELFDEGGRNEEWHRVVTELLNRLFQIQIKEGC